MFWGFYIFWSIVCWTIGENGVRGEIAEVLVEAGSKAVLPCMSTQSSTSIESQWTKENEGVVVKKQKNGVNLWGYNWERCRYRQASTGDHSLHITDVRESDGGSYTCTVTTGRDTIQKKVILRVIKVSVSPMVPVEGEMISISCRVTPRPGGLGATVFWKLNGEMFWARHQDGLRVSSDESDHRASESTVSGNCSVKLAGNWSCVVINRRKPVTVTFPLSVTAIVQPPDDNTRMYASLGSAATLPCVFSPGSVPSDPVWEKMSPRSLSALNTHSSLLLDLPSPSSQTPWDRSASLREVGPEDGGKYRCSGTLDGHWLSRKIQLVVAKVVSNSPPTRGAPITLTCELSDPGEVIRYDWVRVSYNHTGVQSVTTVQKGKVLNFKRLTDENIGEWACRFYGRKGILGNATYYIQLTSRLIGQRETTTSNNTPTVIGLSFFLIILLIILAQMYKNHQRKKKILQYPALESIVHSVSNEREKRERNRVKDVDTHFEEL